jgi:hypothetical protein
MPPLRHMTSWRAQGQTSALHHEQQGLASFYFFFCLLSSLPSCFLSFFRCCSWTLHSMFYKKLSIDKGNISVGTRSITVFSLLSYSDLSYLLCVGVEGYCYSWSHSLGLPWTTLRPVKETSTCTKQHRQGTKMHAPKRIRNPNPSKRTAADLRLRPCGCLHRLLLYYDIRNWNTHFGLFFQTFRVCCTR